MAGQTYQVNYIVNVDAVSAQNAINSFKRAVASMDKATKPLIDLQNKVRGLVETMSALNRGKYSVNINTKPATQKIGKLIRALQMAKSEVQQLNAMGVTLGATKGRAATKAIPAPIGGSRASQPRVSPARTTPATSTSARAYTPMAYTRPGNLSYKLFGPTPLPNNGGMAIDMLKGMGIAYGIAGMGTMVSNIVNQAAEYDNLMKTVENILKSHDTGANFSGRFSSMSTTVRNVGMETKFKVTEVADAAKFLAMAGLNVEAISQAIRPIADIALVGDTELGQTADLVTNIMTAYNIAPGKMRNAADIMTNTFTMSNTTLTEIAEAYKYAASLLSAGDVPFEEATAAIGVLGDAGIKGSQAGTTLRTIMANVVNPTKKQQKAWAEIGVNRFNSDGSRKSLLEIFKELNQANLDVSTYYRLFHKTAASGAVALASHAGKWEDVYLENFLAGGLSANLADAKKNTLQGLWAQLVSVFTDKGVTAFNSVQGQIRDMMTTAINWLKSDQASKAFKEISKNLMEFVHTIIDATKWFAKLYGWAWPFIKVWAKFQLMIWPVVKAVTALRSVFLAIMGIRKLGLFISGLITSFRSLGTAATFASRGVASVTGTGVAATAGSAATSMTVKSALGGLFMLSPQQATWAKNGFSIMGRRVMRPLDLTPRYDRGSYDIVGRHQYNRQELARVQRERKIYNRRAFAQQAVNVAGGAAGALALGYGMHKIADADNGYDTWSGVMYGIAGTAAMVGGPYGWGIAAGAAIVGGIMQAIGSATQSNKIYGELQEFAKKNAINSGVIAGSESRTMQYLEAQYTKYNDINGLIEKRIELTAKLLGLQSGDNPMDASTGVFQGLMEKHEDLWESDNLKAFNEIYRDKFNSNKHLIFYKGAYYLTTADSLTGGYVNEGGKSYYKVQGVNGEEALRAGTSATNSMKAAFASMAATAELMSPGGYYEKLVEGLRLNIAKLGRKGASALEADSYFDQIAKANNPAFLSNLIGLSDIKDTDWDLSRMLLDKESRTIMWASLQALITPMQNAFHKFRNEVESGNLSSSTLRDYLRYVIGDQAGLAVKDYNPSNIADWYANHGYENGVFTGYTTTDENGIVHVYTAEEAAKMAASNMQTIIDAVKQSGAASQPAAIELMNFCNVLLTQAQSFSSASEELIDVSKNQEITLNGQLYRWNELLNMYEAIGENGELEYIKTRITGLSNSISSLGNSLGYDWNTGFNGLSDSILSVHDFLNMYWSVKSGTPYLPRWNYSEDELGTSSRYGLLGAGGQSNSLLGNGWRTVARSGRTSLYDDNWSLSNLGYKTYGRYTPNRLSLERASAVIANGGGTAVGWGQKVSSTDTNDNSPETEKPNQNHGLSSSDYKSHYKERAIPKQININIQNLMNVDSIDMTSPEKAAVIDRVKREIAYALVEAASDGTMMLNGLTN